MQQFCLFFLFLIFSCERNRQDEKEKEGIQMSKIKFEFYDETKDAEAVASLMKRNQFWIGKYDENLTGEKFIDYQRKKGTIFGVVGKVDGEIISYVGAYKTGGQKVANKNQVFVCALIIDYKYQKAMFTIQEMFSLIIKELLSRGYNDFICEVAKENYASFYMMRKLGFVIIDEKRTLYGDYVLHNYLPGVIKLSNRFDYVDGDSVPRNMQKIDKNNLYHAEKIIDGRFIQIDCISRKKEHTLFIDTISGNIAGLHMKKAQVKIWPCDKDFSSYSFDDLGKTLRESSIDMCFKDQSHKIIKMDAFHTEFKIPENVDTISLHVEDCDDEYTFFIDEMRELAKDKLEQKNLLLGSFHFEEHACFLSMQDSFKEMWPHICAPYIEGIFIPNYKKGIQVEYDQKNTLYAKQENEDFLLEREYCVTENKIEIHSKACMHSNKRVQPMFQFALYDLSYDMDIYLEDGTIANRRYDPEDGHMVTEEMIFLDFLKQDYSNKKVKKILIRFNSNPKKTYQMTFDRELKCFCQLNYLGLIYDEQVYKDSKNMDFGKIVIEEIVK